MAVRYVDMLGENNLILIFQLLWTLPLTLGAWKDFKDRRVWRGLSTALIWTSLIAQFLTGSQFLYALLAGPAAAWLFEYFNLWKSFDSKMLIGLTLLHADLWFIIPPLTLLLFGGFTLTWKKRLESHCPVVPVFLLAHLILLLL